MTGSAPVAAVTGAGGSLGTALVRRLVDRGITVRALARQAPQAERLRSLGATPVQGDVRDAAALARLIEGADVVFHLAAWMGQPFDPALAEAVNVRATESLVRLGAAAGAQRVVLASSIAVYGPVQAGIITEDSPCRSVGDLYGDTKIEGEQAARRAAAETGIELSILRPTMIYGPESPSWTETPFSVISRGLPLAIGTGDDVMDPIYVEDVARAFDLAGFHPAAAGETFNVGSGPRTWNDFFGAYAAMAGRTSRRIPSGPVKLAAAVAGAAGRVIGRRSKVVTTMIGVMTSQAVFSSEKIQRLLGFEPAVDLDRGMRETEAWLRSSGRLRRPAVALVTGAAGGLGRETALRLHGLGLTVWAADLDTTALADLAEEGIHPVAMDVRSQESIEGAVRLIETAGGPVDVLVNVAGLARSGVLENQSFDEVELQMDVNAYGPLRVARAVSPGMRRRGWGRIINVSSTNGFMATPFMGAYSASKHALDALTEALRLELRPWGVEVVLIRPGAMRTGFADVAKEKLRAVVEQTTDGWEGYLAGYLDSPLWGGSIASSPKVTAKVIARAALARRAPARRLGTPDAYLARVTATLPVRARGIFLTRASGLGRKPAQPGRSA